MALIIREYDNAKDRDQTADVFAQVYRSGEPMPADEEIQGKDDTIGVAEQDGRIVGAFAIKHMTATLARAGVVKCGGIAAVAVRPEARQTGVGGAMMRWAVQRMREDGYAISHLYGFRESFYRKLGWEVAGQRLKITCPQHRLPRFSNTLSVREIEGDDAWKQIESAYKTFANSYSGMNLRTEEQWVQATRGTKRQARVFAAGDPIEAYCVAHVQTAFWEEQHISEFAWATPEGYRSMVAFFASIGANKTALTWHEPGDSPLLTTYVDQGVQFAIVRPIMYRVLDVPAALEALSPAGKGTFSMFVRDEIVPESHRAWRVEYGSGEVCVKPSEEAEIEIDVRHVSQAVMGEPSFERLARQGLVHGSPTALKSAEGLLTARSAYCMDFF
jgi:predicted acetyltransferase